MGKATAQGTAYESHLRKCASAIGRTARRTAKTGVKNEPDVEVDGLDMLPVVAWKAYYPGNARRKSLSMVVMRESDFWKLYAEDSQEKYGLLVQAKARQNLGVRGTLSGLVEWMKRA